jgi:hypothetical protein
MLPADRDPRTLTRCGTGGMGGADPVLRVMVVVMVMMVRILVVVL